MNKVAFVTGGGGYIGNEVCLSLARNGIKVAVCDVNEAATKRTVEQIIQNGGFAISCIADISDSESITSAINIAAEALGGLDIMVHIAGGSARIAGQDAKYCNLVDQEDYVIDRVLKVNLYGALYASRAAARIMIKQGRGGKIINFSSVVGLNGLKNCVEYAAAKGGVISMTKALAKELGEYKINVNSVAPGIVMRPDERCDEARAFGTNFLGRKCLATDVANLVEFLCSEKSDFITGQVYAIDGGRSLGMKGTD